MMKRWHTRRRIVVLPDVTTEVILVMTRNKHNCRTEVLSRITVLLTCLLEVFVIDHSHQLDAGREQIFAETGNVSVVVVAAKVVLGVTVAAMVSNKRLPYSPPAPFRMA